MPGLLCDMFSARNTTRAIIHATVVDRDNERYKVLIVSFSPNVMIIQLINHVTQIPGEGLLTDKNFLKRSSSVNDFN